MPYITKHAQERFMQRKNGVTARHAIDQINGLFEAAQKKEEKIDGSVVYTIEDLSMVYHETTDSIVTVY
jgi:hypothetical protein